MQTFFIIPVVAIFGSGLIGALLYLRAERTIDTNLQTLAEQFNGGRPDTTAGQRRGREIKFAKYYAGIGDKRRSNIAATLSLVGQNEFRLYLYPNFAAIRWLVKAGLPLIRTGDDVFDRAYCVKSNEPEKAQALFTPKIRGELLALDRQLHSMSTLIIENDAIWYPLLGAYRRAAEVEAQTHRDVCQLLSEVAKQLENPRTNKPSPALAGTIP